MNPKINKVIGDIEKTREKIAEHQSRLKELERYKTELENADIVAMVRGINIPPEELEAFAQAFIEQRKTTAIPDMDDRLVKTTRRKAGQAENTDDTENAYTKEEPTVEE